MPRETFVAIRNLRAQSEPIPPELAANEESAKKKAKYFSSVAQANMPAMRKLKEGGVLGGGPFGKEARESGWRNVGEHNVGALIVVHEIGELGGLPADEQRKLEHGGRKHDYDKRIQREGFILGKRKTSDSTTILEYDARKVAQDESGKTGLVRVTGGDLRDYETWGYSEMALRYADSILITTPNGGTDIAHWRDRFNELRERHPEANIEQGKLYGEGILFYDKLEEIMEKIEPKLYDKAIQTHPELRQKYTRPDMYFQLVKDRIMEKIENTQLRTPKFA